MRRLRLRKPGGIQSEDGPSIDTCSRTISYSASFSAMCWRLLPFEVNLTEFDADSIVPVRSRSRSCQQIRSKRTSSANGDRTWPEGERVGHIPHDHRRRMAHSEPMIDFRKIFNTSLMGRTSRIRANVGNSTANPQVNSPGSE